MWTLIGKRVAVEFLQYSFHAPFTQSVFCKSFVQKVPRESDWFLTSHDVRFGFTGSEGMQLCDRVVNSISDPFEEEGMTSVCAIRLRDDAGGCGLNDEPIILIDNLASRPIAVILPV